MVPEKDASSGSYDRTDLQSILRHASRLTGRTLGDFVDSGDVIVGGINTKGIFGQLVESGYFGLNNNSSPLPDFKDVGLELKVTPIRRNGPKLVSKERLILGIINYDDVPERRFNIFLDKDSHILIVFYLWTEDTDVFNYRFLKVVDWEPTSAELRMIRDDWDVIEGFIMRGEAHLLSERHTKYLAACTKGAGHGKGLRTQPFSSELAKQRALSFKASFMTDLFHTHPDINDVLPPEDDSEVISSGGWGSGQSFEEYVVGLYSPFVGKTCSEIERILGLDINPSSKQYYYTLSLAMAGVLRKRHIKEFVQAGIQVKTVRVKVDGTSKESMSFPYIRYDDLVEQDWEDSDLFSQLDRQFFSPVFSFTSVDPRSQSRKELVFKGAFFWSLSDADLDTIRGVWEDTRERVLAGDFDHFVSMSEGRVAHVRPHARDSSDVAYFRGRSVRKMSFWLNSHYIEEVVRRNLGRRLRFRF